MILEVCVVGACVALNAAAGTVSSKVIVVVTAPAAVTLGVSEALARETVRTVVDEVVRPIVRAVVRFFSNLWRKIVCPSRTPQAATSRVGYRCDEA